MRRTRRTKNKNNNNSKKNKEQQLLLVLLLFLADRKMILVTMLLFPPTSVPDSNNTHHSPNLDLLNLSPASLPMSSYLNSILLALVPLIRFSIITSLRRSNTGSCSCSARTTTIDTSTSRKYQCYKNH